MWNNKKRPSFLSKIKSVLQGFSKQADSSKPSFISFVRRAPRRTIFGAVFTLILLIGGAAAFRLTQAPQDIRQQAASCSDYNNNQSNCVSSGCTFTPTTTCTLENWQQTPGCSNGGCVNTDSCSTYVGDQRSNCTYDNACTYSFSCNPMINCTALSVSSCLLDRCAVFSPSGADFSYCGFKTDYRNCSDKKNFPDAVSCNNNYYCRASETCSSSVNCASYGISVGCSNLAVCRLNLLAWAFALAQHPLLAVPLHHQAVPLLPLAVPLHHQVAPLHHQVVPLHHQLEALVNTMRWSIAGQMVSVTPLV